MIKIITTTTGMVNFSRPDITRIDCFVVSTATKPQEFVYTHQAVKPCMTI